MKRPRAKESPRSKQAARAADGKGEDNSGEKIDATSFASALTDAGLSLSDHQAVRSTLAAQAGADPYEPEPHDVPRTATLEAAVLNLLRKAKPTSAAAAAESPKSESEAPKSEASGSDATRAGLPHDPTPAAVETSPTGVVEAILFVNGGRSCSPAELAAVMRGVRAAEIERCVQELNERYAADGRPYEIVERDAGFRLVLRAKFAAVQERFLRKDRLAKLSAAAIEVLSLIAYQKAVTAEQITEVRGIASGAVLRQLVHRGLIQLANETGEKTYQVTPRFLQVFGLQSLEELPQGQLEGQPS